MEDYLKIYTELSKEQIDEIIQKFSNDKSKRLAQKTLAYEVTKLVHGKDSADAVVRVTDVLFGSSDYSLLKSEDFVVLKTELPLISTNSNSLISKSLVENGFIQSNSEVRRQIQQKSLYINGVSLSEDRPWNSADFIDGHHAIIRRGKNHNAIVQLDQ